jgi:hypothetical protein
MLQWWASIKVVFMRFSRNDREHRFRGNSVPVLKAFLTAYLLGPLVYVILVATLAGVAAEAISLWALFYRSDNLVMRNIVLWSMLGLLALLSVKPTMTVLRKLLSYRIMDDLVGQGLVNKRSEEDPTSRPTR